MQRFLHIGYINLKTFNMTNHEVIENFVKGAVRGKSSHLTIQGTELFSFDTCICQRGSNSFIVNMTKYSQTTTKAVNYLLQNLPILSTRTVFGVKMGTKLLK